MTVYLLQNLKEAMRNFFSEIGHTHDINQVNDLQTTLDGKASGSHTHNVSDITNLQNTLDGKASSSHTHSISNVTNLQNTLDGKANSSHTHSINDITNLQTTLNGKASSSHTHSISDVTNLQTTLDSKAGTTNNSTITDGTMVFGTGFSGTPKAMIRNGFAMITFVVNGSSSHSLSFPFDLIRLPSKYAPLTICEFPVRFFGHGEHIGSAQVYPSGSYTYVKIYSTADISADVGIVGTLIYPIDSY